MEAEAYAIHKNNKCKRDVYTASQIDENFYDKTTVDENFYTKTDASQNFYTKAQTDDKFATKSALVTDLTSTNHRLMLPKGSILMFHTGDTVNLPKYGVWTKQITVSLPLKANTSTYYDVDIYMRTS